MAGYSTHSFNEFIGCFSLPLLPTFRLTRHSIDFKLSGSFFYIPLFVELLNFARYLVHTFTLVAITSILVKDTLQCFSREWVPYPNQ